MCGSKRVHRRLINESFPNGQEVRNVPVDECDACGERVYDPDAMAMLAPAFRLNKARYEKNRKSACSTR
jgi:YgiT-type zinc finger domain-containing protein